MRAIVCIVLAMTLGFVTAEPALAYIGPGAGLSLLGAFWTLLMAVVTAIGFLVIWPLQRRLRRAKRTGATAQQRKTGDQDVSREPEMT
jgi:membrane protein implicated in regulation of membrane protease activity